LFYYPKYTIAGPPREVTDVYLPKMVTPTGTGVLDRSGKEAVSPLVVIPVTPLRAVMATMTLPAGDRLSQLR